MRVRGRPSFAIVFARLLLLLAVLTMPASASAERAETTHCRRHHESDANAMVHHGAGTASAHAMASTVPADSEPCPHCPSSSCGALTTCSAPAVLDPAATVPPTVSTTGWHADPERPADIVGSISQEPPTRPPLVVR